MGCNVCVSQDADTMPAFSNEHFVTKSRKEFKCSECRAAIPSGSSYWKIVGRWDGELMTFRQCECCYEIQHVFCCDGWVYGELWEGMAEQAFPDLKMSGECWDQLTPQSKAFLLRQWQEWKFA